MPFCALRQRGSLVSGEGKGVGVKWGLSGLEQPHTGFYVTKGSDRAGLRLFGLSFVVCRSNSVAFHNEPTNCCLHLAIWNNKTERHQIALCLSGF